jgi:nucleoside-diphosphate-sugar epimerase
MSQQLHVVFGAGQIGNRVARLALAAGHRVRVVSRHPKAPQGAETAAGDARDPAFTARAAQGAAVIYDCANPLYQHWPRDLVPLGAGTLHAAKLTQAKLVALDCLYMNGAPNGPISEESPVAPVAKKGVLRAELAELRLAALRRGEARVAVVRGSDFFGADLQASWWGDRFFKRVAAGKAGECLGDPDMPHSYTSADDTARTMFAIGERADALGVWHVPTEPAETTRQLASRLGRALGVEVRVERMSRLVLGALGLVSPFLRELPEMAYQWERPFVIDDSRARRELQLSSTPVEQQVAAVATWARERFSLHAPAAGVRETA